MIQRQWRHWLHFIPEVHLLLEFSECPPSWDIFQQSNALLEHAKLTNQPNILFHHKAYIYIFFPALLDNFGQWPFGFPTALCFVLHEKPRNDVASVGASTATSTFKAAAGGENFAFFELSLLFPSISGGESIWRTETILVRCFWTCFFDEETPFLESCKESKCRIFRRKFLASYARLPAQFNAMLKQRITLQVRSNVQQLPSKDEERTLQFLSRKNVKFKLLFHGPKSRFARWGKTIALSRSQVQNRILLLKPLNRSKFHPRICLFHCFGNQNVCTCHRKTCSFHPIGHVLRRLSCWPM